MAFHHFDIEASADCTKDYVLVQEVKPDGDRTDLGKFCGNTKPGSNGVVVSGSNKVAITFSSDATNNGRGWFMEWYGVPGMLIRPGGRN